MQAFSARLLRGFFIFMNCGPFDKSFVLIVPAIIATACFQVASKCQDFKVGMLFFQPFYIMKL
jgi:hypothetical protein